MTHLHQSPVKEPVTVNVGDHVFFADTKQNYELCLWGRVKERQGSRVKVALSNSTGNLTFDPTNGTARPRMNLLKIVWVAGSEMDKLTYNERHGLCKQQLADHAAGRAISMELRV